MRRYPPIVVPSTSSTNPSHAIMTATSGDSRTRHGTRVPCEIPVRLTSLDPARPFSEVSLVILVNPQGCVARFDRPVEIGATVRLEGLPTNTSATAQVVNCIALGSEKLWLLGLALQEPGNVWSIQSPPEELAAIVDRPGGPISKAIY